MALRDQELSVVSYANPELWKTSCPALWNHSSNFRLSEMTVSENNT